MQNNMKLSVQEARSYAELYRDKASADDKYPCLRFVSTIPDLRKELFGRG
jgi:hypothetical protein